MSNIKTPDRQPALFAVVPADVRYDPGLRPNAKLLYGEITAMATSSGYCWASNEYFAKLYKLSGKTISELIGQLAKKGYIDVEIIRDASTNEVIQRRIWCDRFTVRRKNTPSPEKNGEGYPEGTGEGSPINSGEASPEFSGYPIPKNPEENNTSINNTPYSPPKVDELFAEFWKAYPRKTAKDKAERAFKKLKADRPMLDRMLAALEKQKRGAQWIKDGGQFIPHPTTWLNQKRWEEVIDTAGTAGAPQTIPGHVVEEEGVTFW